MILITGTGRSGTTLTTAFLRSHPDVDIYGGKEDRSVFDRGVHYNYDEYWGTKLTTDWFSLGKLAKFYELRDDMKIIYCKRHPKDIILSKVRRGAPNNMGGDRNTNDFSDDATLEGCIAELYHTYACWKLVDAWSIKLENLIKYPELELTQLCHFLGIDFHESMIERNLNLNDSWKERRYGNSLVKSQIGLYKKYPDIYNGFFKEYPEQADKVEKLWDTEIVDKLIPSWNYFDP